VETGLGDPVSAKLSDFFKKKLFIVAPIFGKKYVLLGNKCVSQKEISQGNNIRSKAEEPL